MTLPTLTLPKYQTKVPSTGETVSYRPFVVKEEKVLLIALESNQHSMIARAIKEIVRECTFGQVDVDNSPVFDLIYLFINIRAKSVGETTEPIFLCQNPTCGKQNAVEINLTKIEVKKSPEHTNKISLGDEVGVVLKYPKLNTDGAEEDFDNSSIKTITECIDLIYHGDEIFKAREQTEEELVDFVENLTHHQFESILNFFSTMPKISYNVKFDCVECREETSLELEGLGDFFL